MSNDDDMRTLRDQGYLVIGDLLDEGELSEIRRELAPHLQRRLPGRNNFEGFETERVYTLVARGAVFERLAEHARVLAICDALLEPNYLLTASQAICIHPGETPQPWHTDDGFYAIPRPRPAVSISTIVAIDPFTAENGATQIVAGSHLWGDAPIRDELVRLAAEFVPHAPEQRAPKPAGPLRTDFAGRLVDVVMPAGAALVFVGTLLHRGGENRSAAPRLALSNQYCQPWARPQESFLLAVPPERAARMSPKVRSMLGYSIHPPFMGHAGGRHPERLLPHPV
jgi:ectoine hydroxylase-related dioxygenase (phytanoyl-CoA dioxygenase family)